MFPAQASATHGPAREPEAVSVQEWPLTLESAALVGLSWLSVVLPGEWSSQLSASLGFLLH